MLSHSASTPTQADVLEIGLNNFFGDGEFDFGDNVNHFVIGQIFKTLDIKHICKSFTTTSFETMSFTFGMGISGKPTTREVF